MMSGNEKRQNEQGFTLIELSMALLFIAFIMVFLVATLLNVMKVYNKGLSLSQINQAGRQINTDIIDQARFAGSAILKSSEQRLCVGGVSYIWNTKGSVKNSFSGEDITKTKLRLVRVVDPSVEYCSATNPMPPSSGDKVTILLGNNVAIRTFSVTNDSSKKLLKINTVISTNEDTDIQKYDGIWQCGVTTNGAFKPSDNQFCAFAEFTFVVYYGRGGL